MWVLLLPAALVAGYGALVLLTRLRFGRKAPEDRDPLLDHFLPHFDIVEQHSIRIAASAATVFAAARSVSMEQSSVIRSIIRVRELFLGAKHAPFGPPVAFLEQAQQQGWRIPAEEAGHELVLGSVTQPWKGNVVFQPLPPEEFIAFATPLYVKIAWTLRVDTEGPLASTFRTETRACATGDRARILFRRYWSFVAPGVIVIRWMILRMIRREALRRMPHA